MKNVVIGIFLAISLGLNVLLGATLIKGTDNKEIKARTVLKVARVIDGDTIMTEDNKTVRLAGIDAPEFPEGCLGQDAKEKLDEFIGGREVELESVGKDNFGRELAYVWRNETAIAKEMLLAGMAKVDKVVEKYRIEYTEAEAVAKGEKKGIWGERCQPKQGCVIKGNYRKADNTRVYHLPECYNYDKIVMEEKNGDKWFCTEKEAVVSGYKKSNDCPGRK